MKKLLAMSIIITAVCALCAVVWTYSVVDKEILQESAESIVYAKFETRKEDVVACHAPAVERSPQVEIIVGEPAEEIIEPVAASTPTPESTSPPVQTPTPSEPIGQTVIDGTPYIYVPGFGWMENEGGGTEQILVTSDGDINKMVGYMGGDLTDDCPND